MNVALFQNVEQTDLHQFVQFWQLIDGKDPTMHPGDETKVKRLFCRHTHAARQFGRIDFANDVREFRSRRKPLSVTMFSRPPFDRHIRGLFGVDQILRRLANRIEWILVKGREFRIHVRNKRIEHPHERTHDSTLGLPLFSHE